ncbi:pyridoxal phosphate-dependent aminotransferase [Candidatus Woesearchaeota archaeon]|nr:pyridoxal phosphate-dependent aminotransferase [Candidatus Woesearchaeota archaeon]
MSKREKHIPRTFVEKILSIQERKNIISLGPGEPDFTTPKPLLEEIKKIVREEKKWRFTHYAPPQGREDLREEIARKLKRKNCIRSAAPENIIVTTGSQQAIHLALMAITDPKDKVLIPNPGYIDYAPSIMLAGGKPLALKLDCGDEYCLRLEKLHRKTDKNKPRCIVINTPNNPTGAVLTRKQLEEIADIAVENDAFIISDEAYEDIVYDDAKHISIASLNGMEKYTLTFNTFSKSYAMCGFRIGYCHGAEKVIKGMTKSVNYETISAPHISQIIALKALKLSEQHVNKMVEQYKKRRDFIIPILNDIGLHTLKSQGTFYAFSNIKKTGMKSQHFAEELLKKHGVAVIPGTDFGSNGEGHVRISYATSMENIQKAIEKIEKYVKTRKK